MGISIREAKAGPAQRATTNNKTHFIFLLIPSAYVYQISPSGGYDTNGLTKIQFLKIPNKGN
jgi:hypothetical protein